jgi:hypothetical protein
LIIGLLTGAALISVNSPLSRRGSGAIDLAQGQVSETGKA